MILFFSLPIKLYIFHSTTYKLTPIILKKKNLEIPFLTSLRTFHGYMSIIGQVQQFPPSESEFSY